jgi:hypothetical protein
VTMLAIDPGNEESAFVHYTTGGKVLHFGKVPNRELLANIVNPQRLIHWQTFEHLAIEMIASYGMPVGREVFETCVWIGRFVQAWGGPHTLVYRRDVKLHLCGQARAKDGTIRQALIDRYGGKERAIGKKANPGPLYGISADVWQALALAVTWSETRTAERAA